MVKPVLLGDFIPPATGVGGSLAPVANMYDSSGRFRNRLYSNKRKRTGEEDLEEVFDLSKAYPPLIVPKPPGMDIAKIKSVLVTAGEIGDDVKKMLDKEPDLDAKSKLFGRMVLSLYEVVSLMIENGVGPLAEQAAAGMGGPKRGAAPPSVASRPSVPPGLNELRAAMERADTESVVFGADLGKEPIAFRKALSANFTAGIGAEIGKRFDKDPAKRAESMRVVNDAMSGVKDMEFLGQRSRKFMGKDDADPRNNTFCTMPIKCSFEDRESRINFERTMRENAGLRASMSLPFTIRKEMAAFQSVLKERYPDRIVTVRPDTRSLCFVAFSKVEGGEGWQRCKESLPIPHGILLPNYNPRNTEQIRPTIPTVDTAEIVE